MALPFYCFYRCARVDDYNLLSSEDGNKSRTYRSSVTSLRRRVLITGALNNTRCFCTGTLVSTCNIHFKSAICLVMGKEMLMTFRPNLTAKSAIGVNVIYYTSCAESNYKFELLLLVFVIIAIWLQTLIMLILKKRKNNL